MDPRRCSWAALPLRLAFGFGMAYHGYPKVFSAEGRGQFEGMLVGMGVPMPGTAAWAIGILEVVGGILIILGALTVLLSALFVIEMLVALFMVHLPNGFSFMNITGMTESGPVFVMPSYEVNVLYIAAFLALLIGGAGRYSVDALVGRRERDVDVGAQPPSPRSPFAGRVPRWRRRAPQSPPVPPPI